MEKIVVSVEVPARGGCEDWMPAGLCAFVRDMRELGVLCEVRRETVVPINPLACADEMKARLENA